MNRRNTVWIIPLLALFTFPIWKIPVGAFLSPRGDIQPQTQQKEKAPGNRLSMKDVVIYKYKGNKQDTVIRSNRAYSGDNPDLIFFDKVDADVFDKDGEIIKITSKEAEYNQKSQILILIKDVVADKYASSQKLLTEKMNYNTVTEVAHAPGKTTLISPDAEIVGGNFTYDVTTSTYTMKKRVSTLIHSSNVQL